MLQVYGGIYTDYLFQSLGIHRVQVRYRNMVITPNPVVSDEGVVSHIEGRSDLSGAEALQTYTVSFPIASFAQNLADYLASQLQSIECSGVSPEYKAVQTAIANKVYKVQEAIAPYREWELSIDGGATWKKYRTEGDPKQEVVRWTIVLISAGI
jgi:hypothetical protein